MASSSKAENGKSKVQVSKLKGAQRTGVPAGLLPMLPKITNTPFDNNDWIYEVKWDGYRTIAVLENGRARLISRNGNSSTARFEVIAKALEDLSIAAVLDGEVVVLNDEGHPDFRALQLSRSNADRLHYYIFDILWLNGYDLMNVPLIERKRLLQELLPGHDRLLISQYFEGSGIELFEAVKVLRLEGIVAKRKDSIYKPGTRTNDWMKIKHMIERSFVIGGWTDAENKSRKFGTLLLGEYEKGKLVFKARSGTGFSDRDEEMVLRTLQEIETKKKPFSNEVKMRSEVHWVKPQLVADFELGRRLENAALIDTWFWKGWRKDLKPKDIKVEEDGKSSTET